MNFEKTIRILEKIKKYFIEKYGNDNSNEKLIQAEITALNNIINFTNLVLNNFPKGIIQKIINNPTVNNSDMVKEMIEKYSQKNNIENCTEYENIYADEIKLKLNRKITYSIIKFRKNKYIILEPIKFIKNTSEWHNWESFNFPVEILKENQNRKRIKEENE
jgi:hypothetical protein